MRKYILLLITLFSLTTISAQESKYFTIKSLDGKALIIVDSLSFTDNLKASQYYVDFVTKQPYTGKAIVYYGEKRYDSLSISGGVKHGWQKLYCLKENKSAFELIGVEFYSQNQWLSVYKAVITNLKKQSAFARYYTDTAYFFFKVIYKPSRKIIVKRSMQTWRNNSKQKYKFSTLLELEQFFRPHHQIYPYCKQAGFFGKTEIE